MQDHLTHKLAMRLKELRVAQAWSLNVLATKSGISRASLSRLEKGETSPTAEVLGKLCATYGLTMSRLLAMVEEDFPARVAADEQDVWRDETTGFTRQMVSPPGGSLAGEVLKCELKPGTRIDYDKPPVRGLEHHLVMLEGVLEITLEGISHELRAGDCLRYQLHGASAFQTPSDNSARYMLFMV